eukprot:Skav225913  [mRNA]  locus=scaffold1500:130575:133331:+ [translate_table: standard]
MAHPNTPARPPGEQKVSRRSNTGAISFRKMSSTCSSGRSTRLGRWQQVHLMPLHTTYHATTCTSKVTLASAQGWLASIKSKAVPVLAQ